MLRRTTFDGLGAVEVTHGGLRLVIVHEVGPRIAFLGRDVNLLYWDHARKHRRGDWSLRGGHRLWITRPGADEAEETYAPDDRPCDVRIARGSVMVSATHADRIRRQLRVTAAPDGFTVEHRLTNTGDMLWSGGAWALTCVRPRSSTVFAAPLGDDTAWDVVSIVIPRRWAGGHTSRVDDPQVELGRDHLRLRPAGAEAKRMIRAPRGTIAMSDRRLGIAFVKRAAFDADAAYPLGTNLALYLAPDREFVEMETMSGARTLAPGDVLRHVEHWTVTAPQAWVHARG